MMNPPVLLAAGEWVQLLIFLFVVGSWIISQLINASKTDKPEQPAQPRRNPPPNPAPRDAEVNEEISDFLRRTSEGRSSRPSPATRSAPPREPVYEAEILANESVEDHVTRHLGGSSFTEHADHLTDDISMSDERLEDRLHRTFDHRLGSLDQDDAMESDPTPVVETPLMGDLSADQLAHLLSTADGMRTAIVLSEIIDRPEHRWT